MRRVRVRVRIIRRLSLFGSASAARDGCVGYHREYAAEHKRTANRIPAFGYRWLPWGYIHGRGLG
jgi:hypothetical protein